MDTELIHCHHTKRQLNDAMSFISIKLPAMPTDASAIETLRQEI